MANTTDLSYQSSGYAPAPSASDDPDVIRRQIEYTRAQMTGTINQIGERLSPDYLLDKAKTSVREATVGRFKDMSYEANRRMEGMSNNMSDTVRANPLPVALIGRLAVNKDFQGKGLGSILFADACQKVARASAILAVAGIVLEGNILN